LRDLGIRIGVFERLLLLLRVDRHRVQGLGGIIHTLIGRLLPGVAFRIDEMRALGECVEVLVGGDRRQWLLAPIALGVDELLARS